MFKKISLIAIASVLACSFTSDAQSTSPRFGTASNQDKTFRSVALYLTEIEDTAGSTTDTVTISPNGYCGHVIMTVTDSAVLSIRSVATSYLGDNFTITLQNTSGSGHFVDFLGYSVLATKWGMASTGTKISLASGLTATLKFYFDGTTWNEVSRSIR